MIPLTLSEQWIQGPAVPTIAKTRSLTMSFCVCGGQAHCFAQHGSGAVGDPRQSPYMRIFLSRKSPPIHHLHCSPHDIASSTCLDISRVSFVEVHTSPHLTAASIAPSNISPRKHERIPQPPRLPRRHRAIPLFTKPLQPHSSPPLRPFQPSHPKLPPRNHNNQQHRHHLPHLPRNLQPRHPARDPPDPALRPRLRLRVHRAMAARPKARSRVSDLSEHAIWHAPPKW